MNSTLMSKITERGQITLPKRVRETRIFRNAHAVTFTETSDALIIRPVRHMAPTDDYLTLLDHTMRDWTDTENDNLFDFA